MGAECSRDEDSTPRPVVFTGASPPNACPSVPSPPSFLAQRRQLGAAVRRGAWLGPVGSGGMPERRGVPGAGLCPSGGRLSPVLEQSTPPRDAGDRGPPLLPSALSFPYSVICYFIIYSFVFICCPLAAALPGLPAPGVCVGVVAPHSAAAPPLPPPSRAPHLARWLARAWARLAPRRGRRRESGCMGALPRRTHRRCIRVDRCAFAICFPMLFSCPVGRGSRRWEPRAPAQGGSSSGRGRPGPGRAAGSGAATPALREGVFFGGGRGGGSWGHSAPRPSADSHPPVEPSPRRGSGWGW